jgi:Mg2+/Co2+ transporter CorC
MRGVLNFIFGDVSGGSRATAGYYAEKDNNIYEVPGDMKLNDFDNLTNFGIEDPRMTTIAGFAFRLLDRLPREGDQVESEDIIIQIQEMDDHRISRVRVAKGVDKEDFNREEAVIQTEEDFDPQAQDREDIDDIPEDVDDSVEIEPEDETDLVEKA